MFVHSMEVVEKCQNSAEDTETKTEMSENASDRESSIESFHTNKSEISIATEAELIDVDDIELSDEESWLYKSPKKQSTNEKNLSSEKWLQKDVEDMDDGELTATRTALLSKLNHLKFLNSKIDGKTKHNPELLKSLRKDSKVEEKTNNLASDSINNVENKQSSSVSSSTPDRKSISTENNVCNSTENDKSVEKCHNWKDKEVLDVTDIQKIAKLQEESLKLSTYKFLSQTGRNTPSNRDLSPVSPAQVLALNKPASVEALNTCVDKTSHPNMYSMVPLQGMRKPTMFNSATALNSSQELHRGSLPNINKGYYSLKARKPKHPSDSKKSCPLPVYPKHSKAMHNGTMPQVPCDSQLKSKPPYDHRESHTLPSSYRNHSRSQSSSRRDLNTFGTMPRRDSVPILGSNSAMEPNQKNLHRKFSSPVSSMNNSRYTSSIISPTKPLVSQSQNLRSPPSIEYHRAASHSPSRRLPLSTVQQQSPKKTPSPRNGEIGTLKVSSKIPSPTLRSGIPVPSTYMSRASDDDSWSQDCF